MVVYDVWADALRSCIFQVVWWYWRPTYKIAVSFRPGLSYKILVWFFQLFRCSVRPPFVRNGRPGDFSPHFCRLFSAKNLAKFWQNFCQIWQNSDKILSEFCQIWQRPDTDPTKSGQESAQNLYRFLTEFCQILYRFCQGPQSGFFVPTQMHFAGGTICWG